MNKSILTQIIMLMLLATGATSAQEVNKLYFGDVTSSMELTAYVPVYLENTSTDITAVQFDIELPKNVSFNNFNSSNITLNSERIDGHTVTVTNSGQKGRILLSSSANKPIKGNSGELLRFPVRLNSNLVVGEAYNISISKVFIPNTAGENVVTESAGCSITIEGSPDFEVSDVSLIGVDSITPGDTLTYQYTVKNVGVKATSAGFRIYYDLYSSSTYDDISSKTYNTLLQPGETVTITEDIVLSTTFTLSAQRIYPRIRLEALSGSGELSSATSNNSVINSSDIHILKTIYSLDPATGTWNESSPGTKQIYLRRYGYTGETGSSSYFDIAIEKGDSRIALGYSAVYYSGQYSTTTYNRPYVTITNDDIVNEDDEIVISFTKRYDKSIVLYGRYTLVDDEADGKTLKLTSSKTDVTEGESFTMTVTLPETATNDVTVNISYNNSSDYFVAPGSVTIPAGSQSATFDVQTIDDEVVRSNTTITFTITATNYVKGTRTINWKDNDNNIFSNIVDEEWELLKSIYQKTNGANWTNSRWYIKETKEETGSLSGVSVVNGHVTNLALGGRGMNCDLIPEFFMFPKLKTLYLWSNGLNGNLEDVFVNISEALEDLTSFTIQDNSLTGNIGACNLSVIMPALTTLNISNNKIRDIMPALPSSITSLTFSGQTLDENLGSFTDFYKMTFEQRQATLPTIMTYNHRSQSYAANNYSYNILGDGWGFNILWNATPSMSYCGGYNPWNKLPSGQVLSFINSSNNNSMLIDFEFQQGDANFNGVINLSDLQTIITFALQPEANQTKPFNFYAANLIEDDIVNVQDVVAHINLMLDNGFTPSFARRRITKRESEPTDNEITNCIYVEDGKLILKSDTPVAALDIILSGDNVQWTEATSWFTKKQRGSRTIFYSLFGDEIAVGETILANFDGTIEDAMVVALDGTEIPLSIGINNADGIEALDSPTIEKSDYSTIYDLSGRKLGTQNSKRTLPRGVYIVNGKKQVIK